MLTVGYIFFLATAYKNKTNNWNHIFSIYQSLVMPFPTSI